VKSSIILFLITVLLNIQSVNAQNDSLKGKYGLLYSFSRLDLNDGLGGKMWLSANDAIRLKFYGNYRNVIINGPKDYSISARFGYEKHLESIDIVSPYIGTSIGYDYQSDNSLFNDSYVLEGFIGIELWVYKSITLSAEQELALIYYPKMYTYSKQYLIETRTSYLTASIYF
jgi:hypothetical protein